MRNKLVYIILLGLIGFSSCSKSGKLLDKNYYLTVYTDLDILYVYPNQNKITTENGDYWNLDNKEELSRFVEDITGAHTNGWEFLSVDHIKFLFGFDDEELVEGGDMYYLLRYTYLYPDKTFNELESMMFREPN